MKHILGGVAVGALAAGGALAGGIDRSTQSTAILFERGTYAEFTMGRVSPDVSGSHSPAVQGFLGVADSGDMTGGYNTFSFGFKTALSEKLDLALVLDQPIGADVNYATGTGYIYAGSTATVESTAVTAMLRYKLPSNFSLIGGLRIQEANGDVGLFNGYTVITDTSRELGYLIGVAWEKPEIAARVSLTYNSSITHGFNSTENISPVPTSFDTEVPQSLNLEFQTGVAADTLLFGSVRWVDWDAFDITPPALLMASGASLVDYENDTITYSLGLGRKFTDQWSGAFILGYEPSNGGFSSNLGPTDGFTSVGLAATYTHKNMKITGGARYIWIGDADTTTLSIPPGTTLGEFTDNSGVAFGLKVGYTF